ncbi:MAG: ATP-grasp domain-containing protein [Pseudoxanthomonas suwonensis]|nr:MAG: ATP-grasp domain-containing protein [Pseudoxanthomonas suwonensis]
MADVQRRVLILGARAPVALDHARRFAAQGWRVLVGDSISCHITADSRAVSGHVRLPSARFATADYARDLNVLIARERIDLLLPTCEEAFYLSRIRAHLPASLRVCVAEFDTMHALHSKWTFLQHASASGMAVPDSACVRDIGEARDWAAGRAAVLKPEYSRFGVHVQLHPQGLDDAASLPLPGNWVVQALCRGQELCSYAVADRGRLLAHVCYEPVHRLARSSSYWFRSVDCPPIRTVTAGLVARLGYTGQISFDWIRTADGRCHVLECNPRAISGVHLFDLHDALPAALDGSGSACIEPMHGRPRMIAAVMASAGLLTAAKNRQLKSWLHDWRQAQDVLAIRGDRVPLFGAVRDLASYAWQGWRQGCTLREAATCDTEWDGEPIPLPPAPPSPA